MKPRWSYWSALAGCIATASCIGDVVPTSGTTSSTSTTSSSSTSAATTGSGMVGDHCTNGVLDVADGETDIDCGGTCSGCALGVRCSASSDCATGTCDPAVKRCGGQPAAEWDVLPLQTTNPPSPRQGVVLAPLPDGNIMMAGGTDTNGPVLDVSYVFDGTTWTPVGGISASSAGLGLAEWTDGAVVVGSFGGTFRYAPASQWTSVAAPVKPASPTMPREFPNFAFDPNGGAAYLFGGSDGTNAFNDLWRCVFTANGAATWTKLFPAHLPQATSGVEGGVLVYDPMHDQLVLFGGRTDGSSPDGTDETYLYSISGGDWTNPPLLLRPPKRHFAAAAWDPFLKRVIMHGGGHANTIRSDTWAWDGTSWTQFRTSAPLTSYWNGMAFSAKTGRMVLFGGFNLSSGLVSNRTWELRVLGNACNTDTDCYPATKCVDHICCSSASCPTGQSCNGANNPGVCSL